MLNCILLYDNLSKLYNTHNQIKFIPILQALFLCYLTSIKININELFHVYRNTHVNIQFFPQKHIVKTYYEMH